MIKIIHKNETHLRLDFSDYGEESQFSDFFTFFVPGYRYMPSFRNGMWDGKIRLFNQRGKAIYKGLLQEIIKYFKNQNFEYAVDPLLQNPQDLTRPDVESFVNGLDLFAQGEKLEIREYQYDAVFEALKDDRKLLLSPTASGKSMIIMSYLRWHLQFDRKILIVVPTTMLVNQLFSDFKDYSSENGFDVEEHVSLLYSGKERVFNKSIVISTWQSIAAMKKTDLKSYTELTERTDVAVWDEAHTYKADVVLSVMEGFVNTKYRLGTTGTIDDAKLNALVLTGLMGPIYQVTTTSDLMKDGHVVKLAINCVNLIYPENICKEYKGMDYKEEINFLIGYKPRNAFIARLCSTVPGNILVLFNFVDRHGQVLVDLIKEQTKRPVFFIHGKVGPKEREEIRILLNNEKDAIVVATSSLMSTGVNIPAIDNIVFAIPSKSTIRIRQSIGRGLRLKEGKDKCILWDISDDLRYKKYQNTTLRHFEDRLAIYSKEKFEWNLKKLKIG